MRTLILILTLALTFTLQAAPDKKEPAKPADKPAPAEKKAEPKSLPFNLQVDEIAADSFTAINKDGTKVKNLITATTEVKQGKEAAKFADIKVGDIVAGLRTKTSDTEWMVVKTTKFGPKA